MDNIEACLNVVETQLKVIQAYQSSWGIFKSYPQNWAENRELTGALGQMVLRSSEKLGTIHTILTEIRKVSGTNDLSESIDRIQAQLREITTFLNMIGQAARAPGYKYDPQLSSVSAPGLLRSYGSGGQSLST